MSWTSADDIAFKAQFGRWPGEVETQRSTPVSQLAYLIRSAAGDAQVSAEKIVSVSHEPSAQEALAKPEVQQAIDELDAAYRALRNRLGMIPRPGRIQAPARISTEVRLPAPVAGNENEESAA